MRYSHPRWGRPNWFSGKNFSVKNGILTIDSEKFHRYVADFQLRRQVFDSWQQSAQHYMLSHLNQGPLFLDAFYMFLKYFFFISVDVQAYWNGKKKCNYSLRDFFTLLSTGSKYLWYLRARENPVIQIMSQPKCIRMFTVQTVIYSAFGRNLVSLCAGYCENVISFRDSLFASHHSVTDFFSALTTYLQV